MVLERALPDRLPVVDDTVDRIIDLVSDRARRPGSRLDERRLVITLGVSRATVRQALRYLGAHGAVDVVPGKGAFITDITGQEAEDLFDLRARIDPLLVARFVECATAAEVAHFADSVRTFVSAARRGSDLATIRSANDDLYDVLLGSAVGWPLRKTVRTARLRIRIFSRRHLSAQAQLDRFLLAATSIELMLPSIAKRDVLATRWFCERAMMEDQAATLRALQHAVT